MAEEKKESVVQEEAACEQAPDEKKAAEEAADSKAVEDSLAQDTEAGTDNGETAGDGSEEAGETQGSEEEEAGDGSAEESGDKKAGKGAWGFGFGKNKKDDKKDQQIAELTDKVKRQMAEFDNFRKRSEKEKSAMFEIGAKSVLEKLLPIVDNFERGLAAIPEEEKENPTAVGMDKIYKQLMKAMEELDVKPIEAVGQEFSPDFHNAVMQAEVEGVDENIIVEEFQKGYLYRGSVLRHSMVKVNK